MLELLLAGFLTVASSAVPAPQTALLAPTTAPPRSSGSPAAVQLQGSESGGTPDSFRATVVSMAGGQRVSTDWVLERYSLRSPQFSVTRWSESGGALTATPAIRTYRGWVAGRRAETVVIAHLSADGLHGTVFENGELLWSLEPEREGSRARLAGDTEGTDRWLPHRRIEGPPIAAGSEFTQEACGSDRPALSTPEAMNPGGSALNATVGAVNGPTFPAGSPNVLRLQRQSAPARIYFPADCGKLCEIAFESDFEYYLARGGTIPDTITAIEGLMNLVDYYYGRDLNVRFELTHFLVRTAPFYTPTTGGDLLNQFRAEWNGPQAGIQRDLAHLMTAKPGSVIQYGGLAWVGALCGGIQYGWSTHSANALGHEIGHNFGAPHCLDTAECNNMCGGCLNIAGNTRRRKFEHMASVNCLSDGGAYPTPVPPYVEGERFDINASQLAQMRVTPLEIDVLLNDDDGNCNPIGIGSFDAFSLRSGQIQSFAVGGALQLRYTPSVVPFLGHDEFSYTVVDSTGLSTVGRVVIEVRPDELRAHWAMEEGSGTALGDSTWREQDGTLQGGTTWTSGPNGSALLFDGVDDRASLPALELEAPRDRLTISGWLRRDGVQAPWSGVIFNRGLETEAGLHFGPSGIQLRYTWEGSSATYNWSTGAPTPDGVWSFFALTVEPDQATVHLHDGSSWTHGTNVRPHGPQSFDGALLLGDDSSNPNRHFEGALDEVRVHDYVLSNAELEALRLFSAPAGAPSVRDGGVFWPLPDELSWAPGGEGAQRRLYLDTGYFGVQQATPGGGADQGVLSSPEFAMPLLFPGLRHYWRVDEITATGVAIPGPVWQFDPGRWHHWRLDETSTAQAVVDEEDAQTGSYTSSLVVGVPGATAMTGTAVRLSGSPQRVTLPALNLYSDRLTITCWFKRAAGQTGRQGLVFSRANGTTAGLDINSLDMLGYHWHSGSHWGWESGVAVPVDQWVFAALVVEPESGTVYLGDVAGTPLVSAVNGTGHNVLGFTGALDIGRDAHSGPRYFVGDIDDVRVFRGSLNSKQIELIYQSSL